MTMLSPAEFLHGAPALARPGRCIRLLTAPKNLSSHQRAKKKWRASSSGKASQSRSWDAWYAKPENRAATVARATTWAQENADRRRAYKRIWVRNKRRAAREHPQ